MEDGVLVRDELEMLTAHLVEQRRRLRPQDGLPLELSDPAVPALRLAVAREIDERVARNALLAERARQALQLGGVVEVPGRLQKPERPARRQRRAAEELGHLAHETAQIGGDQEIPRERRRLDRVVDPHTVVGAADREESVTRVVEEQRVASVGDQQRDRDVRARAVAEVRVPELAALTEAIEAPAALAETVEVLLAGEREAGARASGAVRAALEHHPSVGGLAQQPLAGGIGERQAQRTGLDLEPQVARRQANGLTVDDVERRWRPGPRADERGGRRPTRAEGHAHDPRAAERYLDRTPRVRKTKARAPPLEACHVAAGRHRRHESGGRSWSGRWGIWRLSIRRIVETSSVSWTNLPGRGSRPQQSAERAGRERHSLHPETRAGQRVLDRRRDDGRDRQ